MTFSECYRKAKEQNKYIFDIVRYNPNGTINEKFEYWHHIVTIDEEGQTMEQFKLPLRWLLYNDWKLIEKEND